MMNDDYGGNAGGEATLPPDSEKADMNGHETEE